MRKGCPAKEAKRLGAFWTTTIGGKSVVVFKSDSHMSQDGPQLPNIDVWRQIIGEVQPELVITTGTAGGIGTRFEVGDVIVSPIVRFDCTSKFRHEPFAQAHFASTPANTSHFAKAHGAVQGANAGAAAEGQHPSAEDRACRADETGLERVVTTDFFGFDTSDNHYKLQGLGDVSEMGDAVLGLVASEMSRPRRAGWRSATCPIRRSRPKER